MVSMVDAHSALSREIVHQEKLSLSRETEGRFSRLRVKWQRCTLPIKIISIDSAIKIRYKYALQKFYFQKNYSTKLIESLDSNLLSYTS